MPRGLDEQSSSSGLLLRSWQDGLPPGPPRLRLVGLTKAWRKDRMPRACAGSWMARFETGGREIEGGGIGKDMKKKGKNMKRDVESQCF